MTLDPQETTGVTLCHTPAKQYHLWHEPSASHLKCLADGPVAYYERFLSPSAGFAETPAMRFGTLLHEWAEVLVKHDEKTFYDNVEVADPAYVTAAGSLSVKGLAEANRVMEETGRWIVSPAELAQLKSQTKHIKSNSAARHAIDNSVDVEFNCRYSIAGFPVRCRCDGATQTYWYDWKTTREKFPLKNFASAVSTFHYGLQEAVYLQAALLLGWEPHSMRFIVTSTTSSLCEVVTLPERYVAGELEKAKLLLEELQARKDADYWLPETYGQVHELQLPPWMLGD